MKLKYEHLILVVDDDKASLKTLVQALNSEYKVMSAFGANKALEVLNSLSKHNRAPSLIITDQRMPGITGIELLDHIKKHFPDAIRFLITGYEDMDVIIDAINRGEIHRYISKPWEVSYLLLEVNQALHKFELQLENRQLLSKLSCCTKKLNERVKEQSKEIIEKNKELYHLNIELEESFKSIIKILINLLEQSIPDMQGHSSRVSNLSQQLAENMRLTKTEVEDISYAGLLHDIGKMAIPNRILSKDESSWTNEERREFNNHPVISRESIQFIKKLKNVGKIIEAHHEKLDGSGFPKKLLDPQIPFESKILAVADTFDYFVNYMPHEGQLNRVELEREAIRYIEQHNYKWFDPGVVNSLRAIMLRNIDNEVDLSISQIKAGMKLARDLYTYNGMFLLSEGAVLRKEMIERIMKIHNNDPIKAVYVYV